MSSLAQGFAEIGQAMSRRFSPVGLAAMGFAKDRHEYYRYMADLMAGSGGRKNMLDIFRADAERYAGTPRGVLSAYWAERYEETGADLAAAWKGTMPEADLMIIRAAQNSGGAALEQAMRDVARVSGLVQQARSTFIGTILAGAFGVLIALGMLAALPLGLVPQIRESFSFVPLEKWGALGQRLVRFSAWIAAYGPWVLAALAALATWVWWSLANFTGPARRWLDEHVLVYRLYRDFRGAMFLASVSSMVKRRSGSSTLKLQDALLELGAQGEPWLRWHCDAIVENINQSGGQGPEIFDTGVVDREILYYLMDMVQTQGFDEGLHRAGARTEQRVVQVVGMRAAVIRWVLLCAGLLTVMVMAGWTMAVIMEMKGAVMATMSG